MKQIRTIIGILALVLLVGGAIVIASKKGGSDTAVAENTGTVGMVRPSVHDPSTLKPGTNTGSTNMAGTYTMAEVATHNNANSCWTVIRGGVFDLTAWINKHPGGPQAILGICGIDGTAAFNAQHEGQDRPEQTLASFNIGTLR